jgi:hypothetical protein
MVLSTLLHGQSAEH